MKTLSRFLVAGLQVEAIKECMSVKALLRSLATLPTGVDDLYRGTLARINAQSEAEADLAKRAILWIIHVFELLSIQQLEHALAITLGPDAGFDVDDTIRGELIVAVCCGLVVVDQTTQKVRLIRESTMFITIRNRLTNTAGGVLDYTASDFLKTQCPSWFSAPHRLIASSCITYLSAFHIQDSDIKTSTHLNLFLETQPLLPYAYGQWGRHAREATREPGGLSDIISNFVSQASAYPWTQTIHVTDYFDHLEPAALATVYGLTDLLKTLVVEDEVEPTPNHKFTLLHMAAMSGHIDTSKYILERYPHLSLNDASSDGSTPIILAAASNHEDLVESFFSSRSSHQISINAKLECGCTALALSVNNNNKKLVTMFLSQTGVNVNVICCKSGETPLGWACSEGHASIVRRLISDPDVDVNASTDTNGTTPLMRACDSENTHIVKMLLAHEKVDVNGHRSCGCNALLLASRSGRLHVVSLLAAHPDINIHQSCTSFGTAVSSANGPSADTILKILLSTKNLTQHATEADIGTMFSKAAKLGLTNLVFTLISSLQRTGTWKPTLIPTFALLEAVRSGHLPIVRIFLQHVDVNSSEFEKTGLTEAVELGRLDIVELFLAKKDVNVNGENRTMPPLVAAAKTGRLNIVRRLLKHRDININASEYLLETAISIAAKEGHWDVVEFLLSQEGIDLSAGATPVLHSAVAHGKGLLVEKLIARDDVDINCLSYSGRTAAVVAGAHGKLAILQALLSHTSIQLNGLALPLVEAAAEGHEEVVRWLLSRSDIDVNQIDGYGYTAVGKAANRGQEAVLEALLNHPGVSVNAGNPPLCQAVLSGHTKIVKRLLSCEGIDVTAVDTSVRAGTAFSIACQRGEKEIVELLLDVPGIDINARAKGFDGCGCSAVAWAIKNCHADIVKQIVATGRTIELNYVCPETGHTPLMRATQDSLLSDAVLAILSTPRADLGLEYEGNDIAALVLSAIANRLSQAAIAALIRHPRSDISKFGSRALVRAAGTEGMKETMKLLLEAGGLDVNCEDDVSPATTPLVAASQAGQLDNVAYLLSFPEIDVNLGQPPPLVIATSLGFQGIVDLLLAHPNIDVNVQSSEGYTALAEAVHGNWAEIFRSLINHPACDVNAGQYPPITLAARFSRDALFIKLLSHPNIDINAEDNGWHDPQSGSRQTACRLACMICFPKPRESDLFTRHRRTALAWAVEFCDTSMIRLLLEQDHISQSLPAAFALLPFVRGGGDFSETMTLLLDRPDLDPNSRDADGKTVLIKCVQRLNRLGFPEYVKKLLDHPAIDVNAEGACGCTPLIWAMLYRRESVIDALLERPELDVTVRCSSCGFTPVLAAARRKHFNLIEKLMESSFGPSLDFNGRIDPTKFGCNCSILTFATETGDRDLVRKILPLIEDDSTLNAAHCRLGRSPLYRAAEFGDESVVADILGKPGIDVHRRDKKGDTALIAAARSGRLEAVRILLSLTNINVNALNNQGESALSIAVYGGHTDVARLLLARPDIDIRVLDDPIGRAFMKTMLLDSTVGKCAEPPVAEEVASDAPEASSLDTSDTIQS